MFLRSHFVTATQRLQQILRSRRGRTPLGYYLTTQDWFTQRGHRMPGANWIQVDPPDWVQRPYPKTVEAEIHWHFRKHLDHATAGTFVAQIPGGQVYGDLGEVLTERRLLWDLTMDYVGTWGLDHNRLLAEGVQTSPQPIPGVTANLSGGYTQVYGHWLIDVVPRLALIQRAGIDLRRIDHFLLNPLGRLFHQPVLDLVGIQPSQVLTVDATSYYACDQLIAPSYPRARGFRMDWICQFLRDLCLPHLQVERPHRRIYLTRKLAKHRRILNEAEIWSVLEPLGFEQAMPETLSFWDGVKLFAEAAVVIGPHGSNLTNILFCPPGTQVIEFSSFGRLFYWAIACATHLDYYYLNGYEQYQKDYFDQSIPNHEDMWVDPEKFRQTLKLAGLV